MIIFWMNRQKGQREIFKCQVLFDQESNPQRIMFTLLFTKTAANVFNSKRQQKYLINKIGADKISPKNFSCHIKPLFGSVL